MMEDPCDASSTSIDSSSYASLSSASSSITNRHSDLSTELSLGLGIPTAQTRPRGKGQQHFGWPPIRSHHRAHAVAVERRNHRGTFFVKVYMEGIPIGRKLDLFAVGGYDGMIGALRTMFRAKIFWYDRACAQMINVLTYEDKDGDWMMVGDVPWGVFLSTVKRLKITKATTSICR